MGLLVVIALLVLHAVDAVELDSTSLGLMVVALLLLFAVGAPGPTKRAFERLTKFSVAGVELGLVQTERAERARRPIPREADDVEVRERTKTGDPLRDLALVREELVNRLQTIRDELVPLGGKKLDPAAIVSKLHTEELLDADEAHLLYDLLIGVREEIAGWSETVRDEFLNPAWYFVRRLNAMVFDRHVRARLRREEWFIADYKQATGHRPDFLANRKGKWILMAARTGKPTPNKTRRRLARTQTPPVPVAGRVVVIPDKRKFRADGKYSNVQVVKLRELVEKPGLATRKSR